MMKSLKKAIVAILATALAVALAVPALASQGSNTITISDAKPGHEYKVYQIFKGNYSVNEEGEDVLSNVKWGDGVSEAGKSELGNAATKAETIGNAANAKAFAREISAYLTDPIGVLAVGEDTNSISGLSDGYYLIKDGSEPDEGEAYSVFILKVVGDVTVTPKSAQPTVDKHVSNTADSADNWCKVADYAINQSFQFKLTALLADEDFAEYDKYKLVFTDTMEAGITFDSIASIEVKSGDNAAPVQNYNCTATEGLTGASWTLTIDDIKPLVEGLSEGAKLSDGAVVTVIYNAHLNEDAEIARGAAGVPEAVNKNAVKLKYSNNPNVSGEGTLGETAPAYAWVFTYGVNNTKVDGDAGLPLAGAGFKLYSDVDCTNEVKLAYKAYNENEGAYYPDPSAAEGAEMVSAVQTGEFNIIGLDAGTYYLKETTTPAGYNTCDVVKIIITAGPALNEEGTGYASNVKVYVNDDTSTPVTEITVVNERGATLPSTGGMGTATFYIAGAVLLIGAMATLIWRRREDIK